MFYKLARKYFSYHSQIGPSNELHFMQLNIRWTFYLLILRSGDISLNPVPDHRDRWKFMRKNNFLEKCGIHFIHLNINSLLPEIVWPQLIAESNLVLGTSESKLQKSLLECEIQINCYKNLLCDRNRNV